MEKPVDKCVDITTNNLLIIPSIYRFEDINIVITPIFARFPQFFA